MTLAEIEDTIDLMRAAGRNTIPISLTEWREYAMATKIKATIKTDATGRKKVQPIDSTPNPLRGAKARKAARTVKGLKANRASKGA
jgi:hypothetical protein